MIPCSVFPLCKLPRQAKEAITSSYYLLYRVLDSSFISHIILSSSLFRVNQLVSRCSLIIHFPKNSYIVWTTSLNVWLWLVLNELELYYKRFVSTSQVLKIANKFNINRYIMLMYVECFPLNSCQLISLRKDFKINIECFVFTVM